MNQSSDTQQHLRNRAVVARFLDRTHAGELDVIDDAVADGIVTHGFPGGRNPDSREAYKQFFRDFATAFADMRYRTLALVADGDHVAARFEVSVRHIGQFAGRPATGRRVSFTGMALYRLEGGRIAETWLHLDEAALLGQLPTARAGVATA